MEQKMFSQSVIEKLNYYVYFLKDSKNGEVFYVGKGLGNRVFEHLSCAIENSSSSDKLDRIRAIYKAGAQVDHFILRHGLTESVAFEVEASLIDFLGLKNLSNIQGGHKSDDFGLKTSGEISAMYEAEVLKTDLPIILINLNKKFNRMMSRSDLYETTRKSWVIGPRRNAAKYVCSTYRGLTREVYEIKEWFPIEGNKKTRWGFVGEVAKEEIRAQLIYKSIESFFKKGAANPVKYFNC